jgi:hypothetical protein
VLFGLQHYSGPPPPRAGKNGAMWRRLDLAQQPGALACAGAKQAGGQWCKMMRNAIMHAS